MRKHYADKITVDPTTRLTMISRHMDTKWSNTTDRPTLYEASISDLPNLYQPYLQYTEGVKENLVYIYQAYIDNKLTIATDGSHIPETSEGARATIFARDDNVRRIIMGRTKCAVEEGMTSMTTEHYGIICALLFTHVLLLRIETSSP